MNPYSLYSLDKNLSAFVGYSFSGVGFAHLLYIFIFLKFIYIFYEENYRYLPVEITGSVGLLLAQPL